MADRVGPERIGIFGGTFDPIHNAHLMVARLARQAAGLDRVIFMPAGTPPHKERLALTADGHRLAMVRLAVEGLGGYEVSDLEMATPEVDYTVDTLRLMAGRNPGAKLYFIIGGDSLMMLDQWRDPEGLMSLAAFIAVYRPDCEPDALERKRGEILSRYGGEILLVSCGGMDVSSTMIRRRAAAGLDVSGLTSPAVARYIEEHALYVEGI